MKRYSLVRKAGLFLAGFFLLPLISACGGSLPAETAPKETGAAPGKTEATSPDPGTNETAAPPNGADPRALTPRDPSASYEVLFIGNSFTFYNDMGTENGIFAHIAKEAGYQNVHVTSVTKGGYRLHQFLDRSDPYGEKALALLESGTKFDIVVIQEQSAHPIADPGDFYDSCRAFKALVDKNGGELWLYSTWGYKTGHSSLPKYGKTTEKMEMKLRAAYAAIGEELGVGVAYAGAAMTESFQKNRTIDLYVDDLKHPSAAGSYLAAWTLFGTIFGVDPASLTFNGMFRKNLAEKLRAAASVAVAYEVTIDESERLSSEGVHAAK